MSFLRPRTLRAQALFALALLFAVLLLGSGRVIVNLGSLNDAYGEADMERQVQLDAAALLTGMVNQESGVRGFLNTAQQEFLEPYNLGRAQVSQAEGALEAHVLASLRPQLVREEVAAAAWAAWAETTRVALVNSKGTPVIDVNESLHGKQLFDAFRSTAQGMDKQISAALAVDQATALSKSRAVIGDAIFTALLVLVVLVVLAIVMFRSTLRPLSQLFKAASALSTGANAEIPAMRSDNEVGRLGRALAAWKRTELERLMLVQSASELGSRVELQEILELGSQRLRGLLDAPYVGITIASHGDLRMVLQPPSTLPNLKLPDRSPGAQAFRSGRVQIADLRAPGWDDEVVRWREAESAGSVLSVPLLSGGQAVGVVSCSRRADQPEFTKADQNRAELFVPSLASAIRVSLLFANLKDASEELELANRHKSAFLASMSHELRTPLNAILGFSELMLDDRTGRFDSETSRRFLDQIHSSGQHLLALINDILDLSKVEAGQMELRPAPIALEETIVSVLATVEPMAKKKDISLIKAADAGLRLVADPGKLKQMLLNLMSNAIKFTPPGGSVTITAEQSKSMTEIGITDTGIGISEDDLKLLFEEFKQLDTGFDRRQEGTGLGLALTKRFAELHGGTVEVKSSKGSGSTFTLRLPVEPAGPKAEPAPEPAAGASDGTRPLILVVDDNPQASELLTQHLDAGGFRIEVARSGAEALVKARDLKPVAITLDILLPGIDGWEVLTRLKQDEATRNIPVAVISVVDNPQLGRALGALDYFVKPVDRQALLSRLGLYTFTTRVEQEEIRVLVVDDEPANLDVMQSLLEPVGFLVLRATGGQEGIEMARAQQPHLILLDLIMPVVTGFDVVAALRAEDSTRSIPIMVLTAKKLSDEDKRELNGHVAAVFERNSLAGTELVGWLRELVGKRGRK